jgi:hypothetical protein
LHFQEPALALPTSTEAPRHRSAQERVADCLGGEQHLRQFLSALADAWERGGKTVIESDSIPGSGQVLKAPLILHGVRPW